MVAGQDSHYEAGWGGHPAWSRARVGFLATGCAEALATGVVKREDQWERMELS